MHTSSEIAFWYCFYPIADKWGWGGWECHDQFYVLAGPGWQIWLVCQASTSKVGLSGRRVKGGGSTSGEAL